MSNVLGRCSFAYVISLGILTTMATFDMSLSYDRNDEDEGLQSYPLCLPSLPVCLSSLIFTPRAGGLNFTHKPICFSPGHLTSLVKLKDAFVTVGLRSS